MPRYQYQGVPPQPPIPSVVKAATGNITSDSAGTKSIWLQTRNRAGFSLLSSRTDVTVTVGDRLTITIPSAVRPNPDGTYIHEILILMANNSTNPADACVVAVYPGVEEDEVTPTTLPVNFVFNEDEHFKLSTIVPNIASLPSANLINGMRRYAELEDQFLVWNSETIAWDLAKPQAFNTYVSSDKGILGANQDIALITDSSNLIIPDYGMGVGETSTPVGFWLVNDGTQTISSGTRIGMTIEAGTDDVSYLGGIVGGIQLIFRGYVDITTGVLDQTPASGIGTMAGIDVIVPYQGKITGLTLPKDLEPGVAYWLDVQASITPEMLNNRIIQGATIRISPYFYADFATWNPSGNLFGDFIAAEFGRRRILPAAGLSAIAQAGSGNIVLDTGGGFSFYNVAAQTIFGLQANTANQKIWISINGVCLVAATQPAGTELRSIVSTTNGAGKPTAWSTSTVSLDSTKLLSVTVTFPTAIRATYPDRIAGTACAVNAARIRIYVKTQAGTAITQFEDVILSGAEDQVFTIGGLAGTSIGTTLPTPSDTAFGLHEFTSSDYTIGTTTGASTFSSGTYVVSIAFLYENTISAISHDPQDGCIAEGTLTYAEMQEAAQSWADVVPEASITLIAEASIVPWQTRRTDTGKVIVYNPTSLESHDGTTIWKPSWKLTSEPGRWILDDTIVLGGSSAPTSSIGAPGNAYLRGGSDLKIYTKTDVSNWSLVTTVTPPTGQPAYTATTASFVQPAVNSRVVIAVTNTDWLTYDAYVYISDGGFYRVWNIASSTSIELTNLGWGDSRSPGSTVPSGSKVVASGLQGQTGSASVASALRFTPQSTLPTTSSSEQALFVDAADGRLKIRPPSNGNESSIALLDKFQTYSRAQVVAPSTLVSGTTIAVDLALSNCFKVTLGTNATLGNPSNLIDGGTYVFVIRQDGTGGRTLAFGTAYKWENDIVPSIASDPNKLSIVDAVSDGINLYCAMRGPYTP